MIESVWRTPTCCRVALGAIIAKLRAVFVKMTTGAVGAEAHEGAIQALRRCQQRFGRRDILCAMTLPAFELCMFALQTPTCLAMIEIVNAIGPVDQLKLSPLMFNMA